MNFRKVFLLLSPVLIIFLGVVLFAAMLASRPKPEKKAIEEMAMLVDTIELTAGNYPMIIRTRGNIEAKMDTLLVSEVSGKITHIHPAFHIGGVFTENEILLTIDDSDYQVAVKRALANLASRKAQLEAEMARAEQARKDWETVGRGQPSALVLRKPYVDEAKAAVAAAEADLQQARSNLERTRIKAPFKGIIREKNVDLGQYVSPGSGLARLVATEVAEVRFPLTEQELGELDWSNPPAVQLYLDDQPEPINAHIDRTERIADPRTRTVNVVAEVSDPFALDSRLGNPPLRTGRFVSALIQGRIHENVYRVPRHLLRGESQLLIMDADSKLIIEDIIVLGGDTDHVLAKINWPSPMQVVSSAIQAPVTGMTLRTRQSETKGRDEPAAAEGDTP